MAYISFQPKDYFNTVLYNGTGSSQSITGVGFRPDWLWQKSRSNTQDARIFDAVRGGSKLIYPSLTNAESTDAQLITSFDSDGFTMGSSGSNVNDSGTTNVVWAWKSNGAGSSNTDGSITSTVSASTTSGFSIVTWTGNSGSVGHGLGKKPAMLITKSLGATGGWYVTHKSLSAEMQDNYMFLNDTSANSTNNDIWGGEPTTSTFSVGSGLIGNTTHVAYCFAETKGFSRFSSFVGNGSSDGPFLFCGFKPAFIILKNISDGAKNWEMLDNRRPSTGQNPADDILFPDTSDPESSSQTDRLVDFVSNGVKIRGNSAQMNGSGNTHIFMAFASEPLVSSNGVPAVAR